MRGLQRSKKGPSPWQPINPPPAPPTDRPRNDRNFLSVPASGAQLEPLNRGGWGGGNVPKFDEKSQKPYKRDKPLLEPPGRFPAEENNQMTPPPLCVFQKGGHWPPGWLRGIFPFIHSPFEWNRGGGHSMNSTICISPLSTKKNWMKVSSRPTGRSRDVPIERQLRPKRRVTRPAARWRSNCRWITWMIRLFLPPDVTTRRRDVGNPPLGIRFRRIALYNNNRNVNSGSRSSIHLKFKFEIFFFLILKKFLSEGWSCSERALNWLSINPLSAAGHVADDARIQITGRLTFCATCSAAVKRVQFGRQLRNDSNGNAVQSLGWQPNEWISATR